MKMEIKIVKENVVLYNKSVTSTDIPSEVTTILKEVHHCELTIKRND